MRSCYSYQCFHLCNRKVHDSNLVSRGRSENLKLTGLAKVSLESKNGGALLVLVGMLHHCKAHPKCGF